MAKLIKWDTNPFFTSLDSNSDLRVRAGTALGLDGEENRFGAGDFPRALGHPRLAVEPIKTTLQLNGGFSAGPWPPPPCSGTYTKTTLQFLKIWRIFHGLLATPALHAVEPTKTTIQ